MFSFFNLFFGEYILSWMFVTHSLTTLFTHSDLLKFYQPPIHCFIARVLGERLKKPSTCHNPVILFYLFFIFLVREGMKRSQS